MEPNFIKSYRRPLKIVRAISVLLYTINTNPIRIFATKSRGILFELLWLFSIVTYPKPLLKAYFISIGESMNRRKWLMLGVAPKAPTSRVGGGLSTRDTLHLSASAPIRVNSTEGILTFWLIRLRGTHLIRSSPFNNSK